MGVLVAMTIPGLAIALLALAAVSMATGRRSASVVALDVFQSAFSPGKGFELEQRQQELVMSATIREGDPPFVAVDLEEGIATVANRRGSSR